MDKLSALYLALAILLEVLGTICMKLSQGFTKAVYGGAMTVCYILCFGLMTLALKKIDVGVMYAIWAGAGTALIAVVGMVYFKEPISAVKIVSLLLIIAGVVGLNLSGGTH